ncbi:MAG TPA: hypothetical protein VGL66_16580 [Caulobacteraceae bacterium]
MTTTTSPRQAAERALGSHAADYIGSVVAEYPRAGDPPPVGLPKKWTVFFVSKPMAVRPNLCGANLLVVSVEAPDPAGIDRKDAPKRATKAIALNIYRVVGPLATKTGDLSKTQAACDALSPVAKYLLEGDSALPGARAAFSAKSDEIAWLSSAALQHAISKAKSEGNLGFEARCADAASKFCTNPRTFLNAFSVDQINAVQDEPCPGASPGFCIVMGGVIPTRRNCTLHLRFDERARTPDALRALAIVCDERDLSAYPWYLEDYFRPRVISGD